MLPLQLRPRSDGPLRLLCLGAHCDDIEIGAGGTLLRLASEQPLVVHWVVLTSDAERAEEARASARRFLADAREVHVTVDTFPASFLPAHWEAVKQRLFEVREEARPDVVFTHRLEDRHQDHRLVAELTWNTFRDHPILEYEIPKYEGDLGRPNLYVPLTAAQAEAKVQAVLEGFPTQAGKGWFDAETFRAMLRLRGVECNAPEKFAEAFTARKLVL